MSQVLKILSSFFAINVIMNKGLNILPSFKYDEYMSDDEFRAIRHLHNVIAHRGDPNWVINYEQLKTHISEVIKNLLQQKDHKIL